MATVGRPPTYKTPEQMQVMIDAFFKEKDEQGRPYTVTGLALALGFTSRAAILRYEDKPEFVNTLKNAKLRIEQFNEERLYDKGTPTAGVIFNLTNNYRWENKMHSTNENINKEVPLTEEEKTALNSVLDDNDSNS